MRRNNLRVAFTLSELLIVVSIIVVLLLILLPVLNHAKVSSYEVKSKSNLRQLSISLSLYRSDQGSSATGGTTFDMGLPPAPQPDHLPVLNLLQPPLNSHKEAKIIGSGYYVLFSDPGYLNANGWKRYSIEKGDEAVAFIDPFFNSQEVSLIYGSFYQRKLLAVRLDGTVIVRYGIGDWTMPEWWLKQ